MTAVLALANAVSEIVFAAWRGRTLGQLAVPIRGGGGRRRPGGVGRLGIRALVPTAAGAVVVRS